MSTLMFIAIYMTCYHYAIRVIMLPFFDIALQKLYSYPSGPNYAMGCGGSINPLKQFIILPHAHLQICMELSTIYMPLSNEIRFRHTERERVREGVAET